MMRWIWCLAAWALLSTAATAAPLRVRTWLYYGLNGRNTNVPPAYMADHTEFIESDLGESDRAEAFKSAGGKFAAAYTDPSFVPYCLPPFEVRPGHCSASIGDQDPAESAWLHDENGSRIHKYVDEHFHYQEALDPAAPAAQQAFHRYTETMLRQAPHLDYLLADDSGGPLRGVDGTVRTGAYYDFNAPPRELRDDDTFMHGREAMFRAASRPVFVNGVGADGMPAYGGAYLRAPNVAGLAHENCLSDENGVVTDKRDKFREEEDSLIANVKAERYALCMFGGRATPPARVYELASWWLGYDPRWSIAAPISAPPDGYTILPEFEIVPTEPRRTAVHSVAELRQASGIYVREFGACYQFGKPLGECAAVVNAGAVTRPLPASIAAYRRTLELDDRSEYTGGRARWRAGVPAALDGSAALIVTR